MGAEPIPFLKVVSLLQSYHLRAKLVCTTLGTSRTSRADTQKGFTYQPAPPLFGNVQEVYLYNCNIDAFNFILNGEMLF